MLEILAHRGFWRSNEEKNSHEALQLALEQGWGIELDVRDYKGQLVISHDIPSDCSLNFEIFLNSLTIQQKQQFFAINIKSDGLASKLSSLLKVQQISDYFVFDMSVPDTRDYLGLEMPVLSRISEQERIPAFNDQVQGYWLDSFDETGVDFSLVSPYLLKSHRLAIVSPELHGRPIGEKWVEIMDFITHHNEQDGPDFLLCTDLPREAEKFFGLSND